MASKLAHYLNRIIWVSIPSLFDDGHARPYRLVAIEEHGLWLESEVLTKELHLAEKEKKRSTDTPVSAFFPFAQIAYAVGEPLYLRPSPSPTADSSEDVAKSTRTRSRQEESIDEQAPRREKKRRK